jgi:hypothetical protein
MDKWEYRVEDRQYGPSPNGEPAATQDWLNECGLDGWELIAVEAVGGTGTTRTLRHILKRKGK